MNADSDSAVEQKKQWDLCHKIVELFYSVYTSWDADFWKEPMKKR